MHDVNLKPPPVHWTDIGGQEELKSQLQLATRMSRLPKEEWSKFVPGPARGFLLYGPPGCSKTMAAQAMATESDLNFFSVKGPELLNMYVGESERAIRKLFARARANAPSLIFFDEIDTLASSREGAGKDVSSGSGHHVGHSVLATLLTEMDGFEASEDVLVLAATNRPQALDPALLRAGRFDGMIYVAPPDPEARTTIIERRLGMRRIDSTVDIQELVALSDGFSGAETVGACDAAGRSVMATELADEALAREAVSGANKIRAIGREDLVRAFRAQNTVITLQMLQNYQDWAGKAAKAAKL
jgi:AAA family ATPase